MLTVVKKFEFEAAHHLEDYEGPCANVHGHSYKLYVGVSTVGEGLGEGSLGMIVDFKDLKELVTHCVIEPLDHKNLNEVLDCNPTAERIVEWIVKRLLIALSGTLILQMIRLYETEDSYAEWRHR